MNSSQRIELIQMLARESYFERELTLSSGRASNYYIDCKRTLYLPEGAYLAGEAMLELVVSAGVEQVGGMAAGALPVTDAAIAAAYRHGVELRGFFVRKETKAHGLQQLVEGAFMKGLRTAVIDDTITTGGSSLQAVAAIREAGARSHPCDCDRRTRRGRGRRIREGRPSVSLRLHRRGDSRGRARARIRRRRKFD